MSMVMEQESTMTEQAGVLNLGDIPSFDGIEETSTFEAFADGWYAGVIQGTRSFTDKSGNERIFESSDTVSKKGDSRNIRLQVLLTRKSDGKTHHTSTLVNYRPEDLTQEAVQGVKARMEAAKTTGEKFQGDRTSMTLTRLGQLQKIAGIRQFGRNPETGGLDITPLFDKTGYFRLAPDDMNPQYKAIDRLQANAPKQVL